MALREKDKPLVAKGFFAASLVSAILALIGALGTDIYLASTQWVLVGTLLASWAIYLLLEANFRLK